MTAWSHAAVVASAGGGGRGLITDTSSILKYCIVHTNSVSPPDAPGHHRGSDTEQPLGIKAATAAAEQQSHDPVFVSIQSHSEHSRRDGRDRLRTGGLRLTEAYCRLRWDDRKATVRQLPLGMGCASSPAGPLCYTIRSTDRQPDMKKTVWVLALVAFPPNPDDALPRQEAKMDDQTQFE